MKTIKKIISAPLSLIAYIFFFITLGVFHPIQWISLRLGGYEAHKKSVDVFNFCLMACLGVLGISFHANNPHQIPSDCPLIFVANHQSLYDIPPMIWFLRKYHPKFVSKQELGKGIPSISFNLKHGGSVTIDRKNARKALVKLSEFADYLNRTNRSAVIFPEGTRSRTGRPKKFASSGMQILFKKMPNALVVPVTINNSWKLFRYGAFPLDLGVRVQLNVHEPIAVNSHDPEGLAAIVERTIIADIK